MVRTQDFWRVRLVFSRLFCLFLPKKCHRSVAHCSPREHMDALCNQLQELMHLWLICTVPVNTLNSLPDTPRSNWAPCAASLRV
eukprot:1161078-Pelagomonas_calceolata.AAC.7